MHTQEQTHVKMFLGLMDSNNIYLGKTQDKFVIFYVQLEHIQNLNNQIYLTATFQLLCAADSWGHTSTLQRQIPLENKNELEQTHGACDFD